MALYGARCGRGVKGRVAKNDLRLTGRSPRRAGETRTAVGTTDRPRAFPNRLEHLCPRDKPFRRSRARGSRQASRPLAWPSGNRPRRTRDGMRDSRARRGRCAGLPNVVWRTAERARKQRSQYQSSAAPRARNDRREPQRQPRGFCDEVRPSDVSPPPSNRAEDRSNAKTGRYRMVRSDRSRNASASRRS